MSVDLPAPFSPINPSTSPGLLSKLMGFNAGTPAKDFSTRFSLSSGVDTAGGVISIVFQFGDETIAICNWGSRWKIFSRDVLERSRRSQWDTAATILKG